MRYLSLSLAPSTQNTYLSGIRSFSNFALSARLQSFPICEHTLCLYASSLANRGISSNTIKVYLAGIQHQNILLGFPDRISGMSRLYEILRGIRRSQGSSRRRPPRSPITVRHLFSLLAFLASSKFSYHDRAALTSAVLLPFFGMLRVAEFTCPTRDRFDPLTNLAPSDVSFNAHGSLMFILVKASKTDPYRVGLTLRIASVGGQLCPVAAMRAYLGVRAASYGPLFILDNGDFLTRRYLSAFLKLALPGVENIDTHSFRIGGASAALTAGLSDALIKIMGRWSSDSYQRYIRVANETVIEFNTKMCSTRTASSVWAVP